MSLCFFPLTVVPDSTNNRLPLSMTPSIAMVVSLVVDVRRFERIGGISDSVRERWKAQVRRGRVAPMKDYPAPTVAAASSKPYTDQVVPLPVSELK